MQENKSVKISLAGDLGSGKSTVGAILAEKLHAAVYSTGTIQRKIAEEMGMTTLQLNQYMETHPEIDGKIDDGLRALEHSPENIIIDSRMAWHFVPSSFAVYMAADARVAAERILKAGRSSEPFASVEEAMRSIADRRASEAARYFQLYGVHIKDLENYDYVVDTSYITPEEAAAHILAHYQSFVRGESFPRYELSALRLFPGGEEEGQPAFFEADGFYYLARGVRAAAEEIAAGKPLIACVQAAAGEPCSRAQLAAWQARTGVRYPALPRGLGE